MRLAKYLARCGIGSRRHACRLITSKRIMLNGQLASHTDQVQLNNNQDCLDKIELDGMPLRQPEPLTYWLYHKAIGTDCRLLADDPCSLLHLLPTAPRLYPVGRLDKDSRGLLLLTNDGALSHQLMHPTFEHAKIYEVQVNRPYDDAFLQHMARGVRYQQQLTQPCKVNRLSSPIWQGSCHC